MSFNLTAGNPRAHRIRVYYEGSNTIQEGMALNYNHDTTTNWFGGSQTEGTITATTTTAEGSQNEGKYIRVEEPSVANQRFHAGVVAAGSKGIGSSGPSIVDIFVPNGAIVPVRTDKSVAINEAAYLEPGENTVINSATANGPAVGVFMETIDRSSTAGLALCKLMDVDLSEVKEASTLGVGLSPLLWGDAPKTGAMDPGLGVNYFNDFMDEVDTVTDGGWTLTQVDTAGTLSVEAVAAGGVLAAASAGNSADDGLNAQLKNCAVIPAAGYNVWFEARIKVSEADEQWAIGLAAVDTTLIASGIWDDTVDKVLFGHHTGTADKIVAINARTSVQDDHADIADMTDDTWVTVGFKITGLTDIEYYVNGAKITGLTVTDARIPNAGMCLSLVSQYEAAATTLSVDWVKMVTSGGRDA